MPTSLLQSLVSKVPGIESEFESIAHYFKFSTIDKKHKLVSEGHLSDKAFFVQKGLLFSYKTLESGEIQVVQFAKENYWIGDINSFLSGANALFSVESLEASELWSITTRDWESALKQSPAFESYFRILIQTAYANLLIQLSDIYSQDAEAKYNRFRNEHADLLQRVPQYLVASYLGILPSSLSRIRNRRSIS